MTPFTDILPSRSAIITLALLGAQIHSHQIFLTHIHSFPLNYFDCFHLVLLFRAQQTIRIKLRLNLMNPLHLSGKRMDETDFSLFYPCRVRSQRAPLSSQSFWSTSESVLVPPEIGIIFRQDIDMEMPTGPMTENSASQAISPQALTIESNQFGQGEALKGHIRPN